MDAGGPHYAYRQINPIDDAEGGEPGGNIRVGFFFNPDRVSFVDRTGPGSTSTGNTSAIPSNGTVEINSSPGRLQDPDPSSAVYPGGLANAFDASRRPLVAEFTFNGTSFFVVANHWTSKGGDDPLFGRFQPPSFSSENQRIEQARMVRDFVSSVLSIDASARVIVDGGILVSPALVPVVEYDAVHVNAEFQNQVSDHDPQITATASRLQRHQRPRQLQPPRRRQARPRSPRPRRSPSTLAARASRCATRSPVPSLCPGPAAAPRPATSCCGPRSPAA